ncbi:MAG: glutamate formimidoyltransferase [Alphaproteobacteria bacterium]|nr:glutamate formimidoyltransferase [Alphaproteobacteria bacterium]
MSERLECVPNFSEGRDRAVIDAIGDALGAVPGARLLDVDPDADTHRTVYTVIGAPEPLLEAVFKGVQVAVRRIDLRRHRGTHPRMGAADVLPFVPWQDATMADAVALARRLGQRLGGELSLPGWFYGEAATRPRRRLLHEVRRGEFEGLPRKMARVAPDFGPSAPHPTAGASAVGARGVLVAFNVNLAGPAEPARAVALARDIAAAVREYATVRREGGRVVETTPGRLPAVRALGWWAAGYGCAQVTTNLVDWRVTPPHVLYEVVREEARARGADVAGSELVGMIPWDALAAAGRYYGGSPGTLAQAAVAGLGLDAVKPFDPDRKVIELALMEPT